MPNTNKTIPLKEVHPDMERYLQHDCYCPGEIYDITGFFFQVYSADEQVRVIDKTDKRSAIIGKLDSDAPQAIFIWHDDDNRPGRIIDTQAVDATENNIKLLKCLVHGEKPNMKLDEFKPGQTKKSLDELMSIADAIMIS